MGENIWIDLFGFTSLLGILSYLLYIIYYTIGLYELNPFKRAVQLTMAERRLLQQHIPVIQGFDASASEKFFRRVAWFKCKKTFSYKGDVENSKEIELLISAAGILLTLGMKNYKYIRSVHRVFIYPSDYYSLINRRHHIGEYNAGLRALVFAADSIVSGFADDEDNINLAIHEFAHALYFETKGRNSWEALRFQWGFRKLARLSAKQADEKAGARYFRAYSRTNIFEFFSVLAENYFETPKRLVDHKPTLFHLIVKMLNFNLLKSTIRK